jgi:FtsP/CotA-like multicopper oxidase with cupredoxin domain
MVSLRALVMLAAGMLSCGVAAGDTVILNPVADNGIWEAAEGGISNGVGRHIFVGRADTGQARRALIRFDTSAIPVGSIINSVQLKVYMSRTTAPSTGVSVHRALASWGEGTSAAFGNEGAGAVATNGDATWTRRFHPSVSWTNVGGDFASAASATTAVGGTGTYTFASAALAADVQAWVDNPTSNLGWLLKGDETDSHTAKRFDSREGPVPPQLIVNFTPGVATGVCCLNSGNSCQVMSPVDCAAQGGVYQGSGVPCGTNTCTPSSGACCLPTGACITTTSSTCVAQGGTYKGDNTACSAGACPVTNLTPFVDALPIPAVAQPVTGQPGGAATYEIPIVRFSQQLHRDLPPTVLYGYAGQNPGPTIEARAGQPVAVTWRNDLRGPSGALLAHHDLAVETCMHGPAQWGDVPRTVTHLHGGRVDPLSDGPPEGTQLPGQASPVYDYPNGQSAATMWYHDHALGMTRLNVYMGLAGFYLIRDAQEEALGLPSGNYEVPLLIQDRSFSSDGSLRYPGMGQGGDHHFGEVMLVNGKVWPYMNVRRGKYRFRLLNGSNSRVLTLALTNGATMTQIGSDGGLLAAPITRASITLTPAERADIVVDFTNFAPGAEVLMLNSAPAPYPGTPGVGVVPNVMKFIVTEPVGGSGQVPAVLRTITPLAESSAAVTRTFMLERQVHPCMGFMWTINGLMWDDITEFPRYGNVEIWSFINNSGVVHPMHLHLVHFQVLDRQDFQMVSGQVVPTGSRIPAPPEERGWKDTVAASARQITRVIARFDGFGGTFPYHCHVLEHEDHEMMRQFTVTCWGDILGQPRDQTRGYGQTATITVDATGAGTLRYEWRRAGQALVNGPTPWGSVISGATSSVLTISDLRPEDDGGYVCIVRDECGPMTTRTARLTISPRCDADLNQDGNADQDDVAYLVSVVAGGPNPTGRDPDFNRDGNVDQDDVWALIDVIAGGACP